MNRWLTIVAAGAIAFIIVYLLGKDLTAAAVAALIAAVAVAMASWTGTATVAYVTITAIILTALASVWLNHNDRESLHTLMFTIIIAAIVWITIALVRALEYVVG